MALKYFLGQCSIVYVSSLSVSAQRENNKRFIHEIGKEGNVKNFFYENGKNCIYSHDVSVNRCADVYNRCADQEGLSGRGWISHFRENSNLFYSHCKVAGNKPLISSANKITTGKYLWSAQSSRAVAFK